MVGGLNPPGPAADEPGRIIPATLEAVVGAAAAGSNPGPAPTASIDTGFAYFEGRIVPLREATISIATHAFNYGTGCFEGIRAYWNAQEEELYLLKAREHYQRLHQSARFLKMLVAEPVEELVEVTCELIRRSQFRQDTYVRPLVYKASRMIKVELHASADQVAIFAVPLGDYLATTGLRVTVSSWRRLHDNMIPARAKITGGYVNAALAVDDAHAAGYDDAIMLTDEGNVAEGSSANLYLVKDGQLLTSPETEDILVGITRSAVRELARDLGIPVHERTIDRTELYQADEIFFCGTGVQVAPITEVDGRPIGPGKPGPVVTRLQAAYLRAVRGRDPRYRGWCTPVYRKAAPAPG
jgi:branched-chain amino acid aminotransferase